MTEGRLALLVSVLSLLVSLSPRSMAETHVSSLPASCANGDKVWLTTTNTDYWCEAGIWTIHAVSGGAVPSGAIVMVNSGACPAGYTEDTSFNTFYALGTSTAAGGVGTTGGSTSYTPAGSNSAPAFTGTAGTVPAETIAWPVGVPTNASGAFSEGAISWPAGVPTNASGAFAEGAISWPVGVPTFSGTTETIPAETIAWPAGVPVFTGTPQTFATVTALADVPVAMSTPNPYTPAGTIAWPAGVPTNSTVSSTPAGTNAWPAGVPTIAAGTFTQPTISWPAGVPTIAAGTFTQPTISWPAGVPTNSTASFTPAGSVAAPAFTGTAATIQPPFQKVLFCKAP